MTSTTIHHHHHYLLEGDSESAGKMRIRLPSVAISLVFTLACQANEYWDQLSLDKALEHVSSCLPSPARNDLEHSLWQRLRAFVDVSFILFSFT